MNNFSTKSTLNTVLFLFLGIIVFSQNDTIKYKKKVLDATELTVLGSFYKQDGVHSAVGGGIGTEKLTDVSPDIIINMPIGSDGVLSVDAGISAYSSASSSNINPFDISQASGNGNGHRDDDDDDSDNDGRIASPWVESSGPSQQDARAHADISYAHSSDNRNSIWSMYGGFSKEFDYTSFNIGAGYTILFNQKNTEISVKAQTYFDTWKPIYATELKSYREVNGNLNAGFFAGIPITLATPTVESSTTYNPTKFTFAETDSRNTYIFSTSLSQIVNENFQISLFADVVYMQGLLATPYHRMYFADKNDFFIEDYQLADDREKLPDTRMKYPIGIRANYYISDNFIVRTYYRYYFDDWGLTAHTFQTELPVKISDVFTVYPMYRYYTQTAVDYFYAHNKALSTYEFYTSDYDLSAFSSNQFGAGIRIAPPLGIFRNAESISKFRFKSIDLRYNHYERSDDLKANIVSFSLDFAF